MKFSVADYWEKRFTRSGDAGVALAGEADSYRTQERIIPAAIAHLPLQGDAAIDFGSGVGRFLPLLWRHYPQVTAVELTKYGRSRIQELNHPSVTVAASTRSLADNSFDLIWTCLVLSHIVDEEAYRAAVAELRRVARPDARLIVIEPVSAQVQHAISRDPREHLRLFGCEGGFSTFDLDGPGSHHLITGILR